MLATKRFCLEDIEDEYFGDEVENVFMLFGNKGYRGATKFFASHRSLRNYGSREWSIKD